MAQFLSERSWLAAAVAVLFALALIGGGVAELLTGGLHYSNYFGGQVFAPFAIGAGVLLIVAYVVIWRRRNERTPKLSGKAARRARQAEVTRFPIEDFDKPWNP